MSYIVFILGGYMKFEINEDIWEIEYMDKDALIKMYEEQYDEKAYFVFGVTQKAQHKIYINKDVVKSQQINTLKHELTHCYIWEYGLYNVPNFNEEMVCDLVASINSFINDIVKRFKEEM